MFVFSQAFQQELGARANNVSFVRKRAKELLEKAEEDTSQQQAQLIELSTMWDRVCKLSVNKQERLQNAQKLVGIKIIVLELILKCFIMSRGG